MVLLAELLADWLEVELGFVVGLVCASIHVAQRSIATTNKDLLIKFFLSVEEAASGRRNEKSVPAVRDTLFPVRQETAIHS